MMPKNALDVIDRKIIDCLQSDGRMSNQEDDRHLEEFETAVAGFPEVMECYLMTGEADYQLRILVASLTQFEDFLRHRLTRVKGVANVTTSFALRPVIYKTSVPTLLPQQ